VPRSSARARPGNQTFGGLLRAFRESASLSQEELAGRAHLTVHAVSALERGLRTRPYPSTVRSLAAALGLSDEQRAQLLAAVGNRARTTVRASDGTGTTRPAGVPVPPTALVARERELRELTRLLRAPEHRLVTVTGLGGVGKTRLGVAAAAELDSDFTDGVAYVPLAPVLDSELVLAAIGAATETDVADAADPLSALAAALADRRMLLVLDNVEHVLAAATHVAALVGSCPGLTVLATSRAALRVRGEHEFPLQPLAVPAVAGATAESVETSPAGALFLDRARAVAPMLELSDSDVAAVAGICTRLAGIPLALELAAARTRLLDPRSLLGRLDEAIALDGARDLPARQRTMQATLDWSYGLLGPAEQAVLRAASAFSGGFTLEALESVASRAGVVPTDQVLGLVESLAEQSLVGVVPGAAARRFEMLEPVAQYGRARLAEAGEADAIGAAHTAHFLAFAERAYPEYERAEQVTWLDAVSAEHANLATAVTRAVAAGDGDSAGRLCWALWLYWWLRGHSLHGRRQVEAALELPMSTPVRARAEIAAATAAFRLGDVEASARRWARGLSLARECDDLLSQTNATAGAGLAALASGDADGAEEHLAAAQAIGERVGEEGAWIRGLILVWRGTVAMLRGEPDRAVSSVQEGLASARARGDRLTAYIALYNLSQVSSARGDHDAARGYLEEGMRLSLETGDLANLTYFCDALAVVEAAVGAFGRVPVLVGAAEGIRELVGNASYGYYRPDEEAGRRAAAVARERLGVEAYDDALDAGRAMEPDDAVSFALTPPL
jgi:predicted ATPase/DNA-binding XRE family transcriptional regulator